MTDRPSLTPVILTCDEVRESAGAFVLGALGPAEADAIRAHLATCADPHSEIAELGSVLPALDASVPLVEPPDGLKARIRAAAAADLESQQAPAAGAPAGPDPAPPAAPIPFPSGDERAARETRTSRTTSPATWALRIAAVLMIGVLAGWNLLLQGQVNEAERYRQDVATVLEVAGQPGSLTAVLTAEGGTGPAGLAAVSAGGDVAIAMRDLPPTTGDQVYEAWVIGSDGTPLALGGFQVGNAGTAFFEGGGVPAEDGIVLALTLEPGPGATAPTSPPVSSGTATAG